MSYDYAQRFVRNAVWIVPAVVIAGHLAVFGLAALLRRLLG